MCLGLKDWFVDTGTIAAGSVSQAFEGRQYYRSMRLHKEGSDALVQKTVEVITNKFELTLPDLFNNLSEPRQRPSSKDLEHVTNMKKCKELVNAVLSTTGTRSQMLVNYLKDVSTLLAIVSVVQTGNITQHLQAERQMLKTKGKSLFLLFFNHISCACHNSSQHVFLSNLSKENPQAFGDLLKYGFRFSYSALY